ncbi:hypothetical protein HPB52_014717 [Rhipicephalus sanguineus]|uniref:Uncharacterized protein n=1 Tax=Rhipicephalus sanguineus TaxID=34632 RepID=A0A9D4YPX3_RHISA|nr:hypothetical protein HPB52_014717 [Rhipicephalus sanguineus]
MASSMFLIALPEGANDDLSKTSWSMAIGDVVPVIRHIVIKAWATADEYTCDSGAGHRRKPLRRAECDLLFHGHQRALSQASVIHRTSSAQPITLGVDAGSSGIAEDKRSSAAVSPEYRQGSDYKPHNHPRDTLPYRFWTLHSRLAESSSNTDCEATASSCVWRLHAR